MKSASLFQGEWKDGRPYRGSGHYLSKDGKTSFEGFFRKGEPFQGEGTWADSAGRTFTGKIEDAWPVDGEGAIVCLGNVYEGVWEGGVGQGTIVPQEVLPGGATEAREWRGEFSAANASVDPEQRPVRGTGIFVSHEGLRCTGEWGAGEVVRGEGSWRSTSSGFVFQGEFLQAGRGKGTIVTLSSHKRDLTFEGEWRDSLPYNGKGEIAIDGTTFRGEWKEGKRFYHGKKYELVSDVGAALQRHLDKQNAAKAKSLSALRSKSLRALPAMAAGSDKGGLDGAENIRAAQRAARRERRKEKERVKAASPTPGIGAGKVGSPAAAKSLPALDAPSKAAAAAAAAPGAAATPADDLYKIRKDEPPKDDTERRNMVSKLVSSSVRMHEAKQSKGREKKLTPLEEALQKVEASAPTRRSRKGADDKTKRKPRRTQARAGTDGDASAAVASGVAAIEGWLKNAKAAKAKEK
eukprot:COSAG02_NODE_803_length_17021_cov_18.597270_4_plen_465_part_00